jgi:hypothetical protein
VNRRTHRFAAGLRDRARTLARAAIFSVALLGASENASAHGGALSLYDVKWLDDTPYLWSSYGLFIGYGDRRWNLLCEGFFAADRTPEVDAHPVPVLLSTGAVVAGSYLGFRVYNTDCPINQKSGVWGDAMIVAVAALDSEGQTLAAIVHEPLAESYRVEFSTDFGETSRSAAALPDGFVPQSLVIKEEPRRRIYAVGRSEQVRLTLVVSEDEGESWATLFPEVPDELAYVSLIAVDAPAPGKLLLSRDDSATGTTLWSWDEQGGPGELLLVLPDLQGVAGFTFGAEPSTLYVAARSHTGASVVSGSLYVSTDSGASFSSVSSAGPRYTCLTFHADALYACSDQTDFVFAPFALGRSEDGGLTWESVMSFTDDLLAPACQGQQCQSTIDELCVKSGRCKPRVDLPPGPHTAPRAAPAREQEGSTCSIGRGTSNGPGFVFLATCLAGAVWRRRTRRQSTVRTATARSD